MRKVFLDELPRKDGIGSLKGQKVIDWKNSVGYKVPFIYDDIEGEFEILRLENRHLILKYLENEEFRIFSGSLFECKLGRMLNKITNKFKIEIGQVFKDEKRDLIVTDREYRGGKGKRNKDYNQKWYKYTCNKCGWTEGWIVEGALLSQGIGCSCCCNRTAVLGINTIWDTDKWMVDLGVGEADAKKYTKASDAFVVVECPNCKYKKKSQLKVVYNYKSIGCICGDGFSYPEKLLLSVLKQLNIKFITQLSKTNYYWCNKYRYDFYLPKYNMIIETHGEQHYRDNTGFKMSLAEVQDNDRTKARLAKENGIENYIELDCRESNLEWIKNSILDSKLNGLFDLAKVDWLKCEKLALSNVIKEVCNYWNDKEEWETTQTIAENNPWGITSRSTIINYLKKGATLGWTSYSPKEEMRKSSFKAGKSKAKPIEMFKDGESLGIFESVLELERQSEELFGVKLLHGSISDVCRGRYKQYKGFTFKYVDR